MQGEAEYNLTISKFYQRCHNLELNCMNYPIKNNGKVQSYKALSEKY